MALQKITEDQIKQNQIASLPDRMTGTAAENKAAFDALVKCAIDAFNGLVDTLSGSTAAGEIGAQPFTGVGNAATVQSQIRALQDNITQMAAGTIPDGGVTSAKLADGAVTQTKLAEKSVGAAALLPDAVGTQAIADGAVTGDKLSPGAVTEEKLTDKSVTAQKLADGAVTQAAIPGGSIPDAWLASPMLKIKYGSYNGTGTYNSTGLNSIHLGFAAKLAIIYENKVYSGTDVMQAIIAIRGATGGWMQKKGVKVTFNDSGLTWYSTQSATYQCNTSGQSYVYFAIG